MSERTDWDKVPESTYVKMRIEESRKNCDPLLAVFLGAAVPMWIDQMKDWTMEAVQQRAHSLTDVITSSQGIAAIVDPDARGTAPKGEKARAFNALAEALACLAHGPEGICFGGHHWRARRG
jgi:adenosyl cobinamide kinase/adenosyl cobinamide phosphate guanylyltransferase